MLLLTALFLSAWFWRRNLRDANLWMVLTYAGIGLMAWQDFSAVSAYSSAFPKILKDFIMLGMVGFVQNLAIKKVINIWTAIGLIFAMFVAAHFLEELIDLEENGQSYLIELREGVSADELEAYAAAEGFDLQRAFAPGAADETLLDNYFELTYSGSEAELIDELSDLASVTWYEPNETILVEPFIDVEDGLAAGSKLNPNRELGIDDPHTGEQWAMTVLEMDRYYSLLARATPKKTARIVILDTGIDARHEDLGDNYRSIERKYDNDPQGHGTHCAGIAAGVTNNGIGIGSLAGSGRKPFVEVSSIKVLNAGGMGTQKTIIAGIIEAADEGADVISLSLGGRSSQSSQRAYEQAIAYAHRRGAIVVAAAGNSNRDAKDFAPANARGMITVAAIDELLLRAPFSNRVSSLERGIAAPGVNIFSTLPDNNYRSHSGTSMACPFVAGLLGVMRSLDPDLDFATAYDILDRSGKESNESRVTGRIVQPAGALEVVMGR